MRASYIVYLGGKICEDEGVKDEISDHRVRQLVVHAAQDCFRRNS